MPEPHVPGTSDGLLELPCGTRIDAREFDLGLREYDCSCGDVHAVVTDAHPLSRFVPEEIVASLQTVIETDDDFDAFGTPHVMAIVQESEQDAIASADLSGDGSVGYALIWVSEFDSRTLHERVVEVLIELMERAIEYADDQDTTAAFERQVADFDVETFVETYRSERDFEDEYDTAV